MSDQGKLFGETLVREGLATVRVLVFTFSVAKIAEGFGLTTDEVLETFRDGRVATPVFERLLARTLVLRTAKGPGGGRMLLDARGAEWELRSLGTDAVGFAPSALVGTGRSFKRERFEKRARELAGYLVADAAAFPCSRVWAIPTAVVLMWAREGRLERSARLSREEFLARMEAG